MAREGVIARFKTNTRARMAHVRHGKPSHKLKVVFVVGSDGAIGTIAYLASTLRAAGNKVGVLTQQYVEVGDTRAEGSDQADITGDPNRLQAMLAQMKRAKCSYVLMEVPPELPAHQFVGVRPHMLIIRRCGDDYSDQMTVKARLAMLGTLLSRRPQYVVFNRDDPCGSDLSHLAGQGGVISFGIHQKADCRITEIELHPKGSRVELLVDHNVDIHLATHMVGKQTIYNAAAAAASAYELHVPIDAIEDAALRQSPVDGIGEFMEIPRPYQIALDSACTPAGLAETLETFKHFAKNRLLVVFGAPLGTPTPWLPLLGEIASQFTDRLVICDGEFSESQSPQEVRSQIMQGVSAHGGEAKTEEVPDRKEAIEKAISIARRGDIVLIAATTQRPYRQLGSEHKEWSDRKIIAQLF